LTSQESVLRCLRDPQNYPHRAEPFAVRQTHISWVFLAGPYAYKLKKAVALGFLDYSTPALRRHFAAEELRLNRRLADEVYLGLVPVKERDGKAFLATRGDEEGDEIDTVLRMKRLPEGVTLERRLRTAEGASLESLARKEADGKLLIDRLLERIVPFYRGAPPAAPESGLGRPPVLRDILHENYAHVEALQGELLGPGRFRAIVSAQLSFLTLRAGLFEQRASEGRVVDGHGDLRAEHVVYLPECRVLDCVEFSERYRVLDAAADLAFLRMDLGFLHQPELADYLIERYVELSGDRDLAGVLDFYASYRALVRGKVEGLRARAAEVDPGERQASAGRARRYFQLADFHAQAFRRPLLILVGELPGAGASALARPLAAALGATLVPSGAAGSEGAAGALADRARILLGEGGSVVLDAGLPRRRDRALVREAARSARAGFVHFECHPIQGKSETAAAAGHGSNPEADDATGTRAYEVCAPGECFPLAMDANPAATLEAALAVLRRRDARSSGG
jgi:aminoglycoside phosphotransferase family enzyme/predicted kinase